MIPAPSSAAARLLTGLALVGALSLSACGTNDKDDPVQTSSSTNVCGLVDPALAASVVGADTFKTNGVGAIPKSKRATTGAHCTITRDTGTGPRIQVRLGEVPSPQEWVDKISQEAKNLDYGDVVATYTGDPGTGYGVTYEGGIYALGAGVSVVKGDRVIRVVVYQWPDATPRERLDAAAKIAADADTNLTAYDDAAS